MNFYAKLLAREIVPPPSIEMAVIYSCLLRFDYLPQNSNRRVVTIHPNGITSDFSNNASDYWRARAPMQIPAINFIGSWSKVQYDSMASGRATNLSTFLSRATIWRNIFYAVWMHLYGHEGWWNCQRCNSGEHRMQDTGYRIQNRIGKKKWVEGDFVEF